MGSYNFTYKDVILRHERMINRIEKWEVHALAIIMLIVTAFFTLSTFCFGAESEQVSFTEVSGIVCPSDSNHFISGTDGKVGYIKVEKGYIYDFQNISNVSIRPVISNELPALNVTYDLLPSISAGETYSYLSNEDTYIYICFNSYTPNLNFNDYLTVTRTISDNYNGAIDGLVENVGVNQIWDVFGSGVNFVYVVIIVAFGIFLIALAIRKVSKGKSEF